MLKVRIPQDNVETEIAVVALKNLNERVKNKIV
jgi:hypothetical protein